MNLEQEVFNSLRSGLAEVIKTKLGAYGSPIDGVIKTVFEAEQGEIVAILKDIFKEVIGSDTFKMTIKEEFQRKVAKNLVGVLEGQVTKAVETLKQDPVMKSKMILAIENIITESNK